MFNNSQKGVSLIITFFIMIIILAVVLSISILLYSEVKIVRNMGNSEVSFYAADSGIEKVLYYDRKVLPTLSTGDYCDSLTPCTLSDQTCINNACTTLAARGLCSMLDSVLNSASACVVDANPANSAIDHSVYCNNTQGPQINSDPSSSLYNPSGCDPDVCNDCKISFETAFDSKNYYVTAKVYPSEDGKSTNFEIASRGVFEGAGRQIKVSMNSNQSEQAIEIVSACATPNSKPQGETIQISATVRATLPCSGSNCDTIGIVLATVRDSQGRVYDSQGNIVSAGSSLSPFPLPLVSGTYAYGTWRYDWSTDVSQTYYVDLEVRDTLKLPNDKKCRDIWPSPMCAAQPCTEQQFLR